ncbi:MAG: DUF3618 domain-containing protein [Gaiellales bacterium]|jgi:hypothetical protein
MASTREQADIERDIEVTREQLAQSIGALSGRLDPRRGIRTVAIVGVAAAAAAAAVVGFVIYRRW